VTTAPPTEPDDAGDEDGVPAELVELHEVLEWQAAVADDGGATS
jgi:hypothetical protein